VMGFHFKKGVLDVLDLFQNFGLKEWSRLVFYSLRWLFKGHVEKWLG
jgi:hypothetical protein